MGGGTVGGLVGEGVHLMSEVVGSTPIGHLIFCQTGVYFYRASM